MNWLRFIVPRFLSIAARNPSSNATAISVCPCDLGFLTGPENKKKLKKVKIFLAYSIIFSYIRAVADEITQFKENQLKIDHPGGRVDA